jgi:hypothetical protein
MKLFFWKREPEHMSPFDFAHSIVKVASVVIIWRGIWYLLDKFDYRYFDGDHMFSAIVGIALGLALLYLPDRDLTELEKH